MIENFINGNLSDARKQARRFSGLKIMAALRDGCGWSARRAELAANYLKTGKGWQEMCDEE